MLLIATKFVEKIYCLFTKQTFHIVIQPTRKKCQISFKLHPAFFENNAFGYDILMVLYQRKLLDDYGQDAFNDICLIRVNLGTAQHNHIKIQKFLKNNCKRVS